MRLKLLLWLLYVAVAAAQDLRDWNSLARLKPGDDVRIALKSRKPVSGAFQSFTPEQIALSTATAQKADVARVERVRRTGWSRGKKAAVGALIGFGGGFAIGAAADNCGRTGFGPCFSRGEVGAVVGAIGLVAGAAVGAMLPRHKDMIYAAP